MIVLQKRLVTTTLLQWRIVTLQLRLVSMTLLKYTHAVKELYNETPEIDSYNSDIPVKVGYNDTPAVEI